MNRSDICPSCKTALRWEPPGVLGAGYYVCPRCKYHRNEGSAVNIWKNFKRKKKRG